MIFVLWLKVRNFVAYENHACTPRYMTPALAVRKFIVYEILRTLVYEFFTRAKITAITAVRVSSRHSLPSQGVEKIYRRVHSTAARSWGTDDSYADASIVFLSFLLYKDATHHDQHHFVNLLTQSVGHQAKAAVLKRHTLACKSCCLEKTHAGTQELLSWIDTR